MGRLMDIDGVLDWTRQWGLGRWVGYVYEHTVYGSLLEFTEMILWLLFFFVENNFGFRAIFSTDFLI